MPSPELPPTSTASGRRPRGATRDNPPPAESGTPRWIEFVGLAVVLGTAITFLAASWRKWCHPVIDSGRELHIPWRLSEGAVLYRDVDNVYGPLSQYFNAGLFRIFGPGLMVLVTANLVVFAAILGLAYLLFRRAWGVAGALAACLVFVSTFAFCQLIGPPVFNYALPYSHEATHGVLVILALVAALGAWLRRPNRRWGATAGLLAGLTLVLKPEFILAAAAVTATAGLLLWRRRAPLPTRALAVFVLAALIPSAAFTVYFAFHFSWADAAIAASRAWWSVLIYPDILSKQYQLTFLGLDQPWANLVDHGRRTLPVLAALSLLAGLVAVALKLRPPAARWTLVAVTATLAAAIGWQTEWGFIGRALLALCAPILAVAWYRTLKAAQPSPPQTSADEWRVLIGTAAIALMARMLLNGRIVQFGFFQAALAAMVVAAVVVAGAAEWMPARPGRRRAVALVGGALLLPSVWWSARQSAQYTKLEVYPVGEGRDRFYFFPPEIEPTGMLLNEVLAVLRKYPPQTKLFALPEGSMVNYLARLRSPLPQFQFYSFTTEGGRERAIVDALAAHPPDVVVFLSRGLADFGVSRYGERDGAGAQIVNWLAAHYKTTHHFGGDPLDTNQRGAFILERLPAAAAAKR